MSEPILPLPLQTNHRSPLAPHPPAIARLEPGAGVRVFLHPGQQQAWNRERRVVLVLADTQGGKTSFGPHWLLREMQLCGPGRYMVVAPTFPLLEKKALPEFRRAFERWLRGTQGHPRSGSMGRGRYTTSPLRRFRFSPEGERKLLGHCSPDKPTVVWFLHADGPQSLECLMDAERYVATALPRAPSPSNCLLCVSVSLVVNWPEKATGVGRPRPNAVCPRAPV